MQNRPELLWEVLSALYLYKRPRRARLLLSELLVATHAVGYPVDQYLPQLCDLGTSRMGSRRVWFCGADVAVPGSVCTSQSSQSCG
eukprot:1510419-Rhodomonas_salina.1